MGVAALPLLLLPAPAAGDRTLAPVLERLVLDAVLADRPDLVRGRPDVRPAVERAALRESDIWAAVCGCPGGGGAARAACHTHALLAGAGLCGGHTHARPRRERACACACGTGRCGLGTLQPSRGVARREYVQALLNATTRDDRI